MSCQNFMFFYVFFLFNTPPPRDWNVLKAERLLRSWHHMHWINTKICIHGANWKSPIFEGKLQVFISYLTKMKIVYFITLLYSSIFCSLFLPLQFVSYQLVSKNQDPWKFHMVFFLIAPGKFQNTPHLENQHNISSTP